MFVDTMERLAPTEHDYWELSDELTRTSEFWSDASDHAVTVYFTRDSYMGPNGVMIPREAFYGDTYSLTLEIDGNEIADYDDLGQVETALEGMFG